MTKKCREIESLLSAYLENELSKAEAENVAEHLNSCPECRNKKEIIVEKKKPAKMFYFPKWMAAAVGTIILFFNLFYFTNIFPPVNREIHSFVYSVERFVAKTGGWFEKIKESKDLLFFTFFNKKSIEQKSERRGQEMAIEKDFDKGGKNG
jgi:hypothetical protein